MPGVLGEQDGSPSMSMLSEVSGLDNSLTLDEIDRIIGNLIGKELERSQLADQHESLELSPHGAGGVDNSRPDTPDASTDHSANVPAVQPQSHSQRAAPPPQQNFLSPAMQRLLAPKSPTPSPNVHDTPTEIPSYVSPLPLPSVNGLPSPEQRPKSHDSPSLLAQPQAGFDKGSKSWDTQVQNAAMAMPLQKITLFRKSVDGDGTAPSSRNVGIGVACETDQYTGHVVIQKVFAGGAAHNSGQVFPSDTLLQINGTSVTGTPTHQVLQMLGGEAGTPVSILVSHHPQHLMAAPRVPPPPQTELFAPQNVQPVPSSPDEEAEERRLVREKVLAARRMSVNGALSGGPREDKVVDRAEPQLLRRPLPQTAISTNTASDVSSNGLQGRRDQQSIFGQSKDDGPSPPVSAVYPLPPAAFQKLQAPAQSVQDGQGQIYGGKNDRSTYVSDPARARNSAAGSPPEGMHVFSREIDEISPPKTDAEGKSLAELKMSFTMRMNEAIRMQRERMRVLLSDVDSKIVSLKHEHGFKEASAGAEASTQQKTAHETGNTDPRLEATPMPQIDYSDDKENDSSGDSQSTADTIVTPTVSPAKRATRAVPLSPPPSQVAMDSPTIFSPQMIERDLQTEKLMAEMGQLRAALAAVTGSVTSSRTASASGEALLPELPSEWTEEEKLEENDASANLDSDASWLQRKQSPSIQRSTPPKNLGEVEADLLVLAEQSKQKYLDIVGRLQKESLKSDVEFGDYVDQSVEDNDNTIASVSEDEEERAEMDGTDEILTLSYNPTLKPVKGCLTKHKKHWPHRPVSPSEDEAERNRLARRGQKRSVLGAGIAASREVLNPGQKTPYSPKHVMTPQGPMVLAAEGPVPPSQHPFVKEQMLVLKCIKQYPEIAQMDPAVVTAAAVRFELGLEPEIKDGEMDSDDDGLAPQEHRTPKKLVWGEGVSETDGNSAQKLHEASLAKRKAALAAAQAAAAKHAEMLEEMQEQHDQIRFLQQQGVQQTPQRQPPPGQQPAHMQPYAQAMPPPGHSPGHAVPGGRGHQGQQHGHQAPGHHQLAHAAQQQPQLYASQMGTPAQGTVQVPKMPPGFSPAKLLPQHAQHGTPQIGPGAQNMQQQQRQQLPAGTPQRPAPMSTGQPNTPQHMQDGKAAKLPQFYGNQRPTGRQSLGGSLDPAASRAAPSPVNPAYAASGWAGQMQQQSHMPQQPPAAMRQMAHQPQQQQSTPSAIRSQKLRGSGVGLPG